MDVKSLVVGRVFAGIADALGGGHVQYVAIPYRRLYC